MVHVGECEEVVKLREEVEFGDHEISVKRPMMARAVRIKLLSSRFAADWLLVRPDGFAELCTAAAADVPEAPPSWPPIPGAVVAVAPASVPVCVAGDPMGRALEDSTEPEDPVSRETPLLG